MREEYINACETRLKLISKWGSDGASGQSEFKQVIPANATEFSDQHCYMTSIVQLQMNNLEMSLAVWENMCLSPTKYCRPIMFEYVKENAARTRSEVIIKKNI
jgi:hypothetical protein